MIITISGLPGSGTTTAARLLAKRLGYRLVSAGELFRKMARNSGLSLEEFGKKALADPSIDRNLDEHMLRIAREAVGKDGGIVLEGRLTGALTYAEGIEAFRVFLEAPISVRAERIARREGKSVSKARKEAVERERCEVERYIKFYGIDPRDRKIYDLVIDSSKYVPEEIVEQIIRGAFHDNSVQKRA